MLQCRPVPPYFNVVSSGGKVYGLCAAPCAPDATRKLKPMTYPATSSNIEIQRVRGHLRNVRENNIEVRRRGGMHCSFGLRAFELQVPLLEFRILKNRENEYSNRQKFGRMKFREIENSTNRRIENSKDQQFENSKIRKKGARNSKLGFEAQGEVKIEMTFPGTRNGPLCYPSISRTFPSHFPPHFPPIPRQQIAAKCYKL